MAFSFDVLYSSPADPIKREVHVVQAMIIMVHILLLTILVQGCFCITLYPRDSLMRETRSLDGIWNFRISPWWDMDLGFKENWYNHSLTKSGKNEVIPMAVPSSFNDITQNKTIRDFIGWVWYDREFYIPSNWLSSDRSLILRFGSAHYYTQVYVNGVLVVKHEGGHLPFATDISTVVSANKPNRITVAINNTLTPCTVPQGHVVHPSDSMSPMIIMPLQDMRICGYPPGYVVQDVNFDFYNYAGIHRSVVLYSIPKLHIEDIIINTDVVSTTGIVSYQIIPVKPKFNCKVVLRDKAGLIAAEGDSCNSQLLIPSAHLWWPWTMNSDPGYLYTLEVQLVHRDESTILDEYHQPVGIRSIQLTNTSFLINNQPFYFTGFGMHEDMNSIFCKAAAIAGHENIGYTRFSLTVVQIKGKGLDLAMILKDYNLLKWIGANSFRTSHYPYSEELMDLADELGFVVIDECPAVALHSFEDNLLELHKNMITEMVSRDKNRPSVVMWSVANEPYSTLPESEEYFRQVISHTRELDGYRPITAALSMTCSEDHVIIPVKPKFNCKVVLRDKAGLIAAEGDSCNSQLLIPSAHLWWPWTMNSDPGYLYTLEVQLVHRDESTILDEYHQPVGIRSIQLTNTSFLINNQPFYFTGFGMHEDMNIYQRIELKRLHQVLTPAVVQIKGKGLDLAMILKDYNLLKWIGANSFRTSHYPYSEELMDLADELGFVVIDECPAVALQAGLSEKNKEKAFEIWTWRKLLRVPWIDK
ncbi:GUSB [Cordylochernes scorpioides]|uniref:GUSB n=1 Tax=Cordylochernes scorpioides TaxID=51811 RepID=A0ABY6JXJ0_9ARAC|nr:GUSB [Cordylochernes scorpioides]